MQGIQILFDQNSIAKLKSDYDKILQDLESKKLNIDFSEANKSINQLTNKVRELQGIKLDKVANIDFSTGLKSIDQAIKKYQELGEVEIKNKTLDPFDNNKIIGFEVELKKAGNVVDQFKYKWQEAYESTREDGSKVQVPAQYTIGNIKENDNTTKIAEQLVKDENDLATAMGKTREQSELKAKAEQKNLEIKQAQNSNKGLEQEYSESQKVQEALAKTVSEREKDNKLLEERQAQAINKNLEEEYQENIKLAEAMAKGREQSELKNRTEQENNNLKQNQASNKALEDEYQERQKIQDAIEKTITKRKEEEKILEETQAKASNKALEQEYVAQQNQQKYLNSLGKDVTPSTGIGFNIGNSTYKDMENLAKAVGGVNAEIKKIDVQPIEKGDEAVRKVTYRVKEGKDKWHEYQLAVTENAKTGEQSLRSLDNGTKDVINRQVGLIGRLKNAWIAVASFGGVTTVFYTMVNEIKKGVEMISSFDKSMTNIQMVTNRSRESVQGITQDFSKLATELKSTTSEMLSGGENYLRAGKSLEETKNFLKAGTIASALSGQTNDQTSEQLIAVANGYKLNTDNAKELMSVVDRLSAVDNASSTSFAEVANALQYTSASAQGVGVSLTNLISYISTVSSVSRRSSESIGQSFKTIFSRYESVSAGKDIDDEGESVNDVEKSLNKIGIAIRSDKDHFKDFNTVLSELSSKWSTLNDLSKSQAIGALAGTRQRENLQVLMENMNQVTSLQTAMNNSTDTAEKKFNSAFGESIQAKVNAFKHSIEEFWMSIINSKAINSVIEFGTSIVNSLNTINSASTSSKIALFTLVTSMVLIIKYSKELTSGFQSIQIALMYFLESAKNTNILSALSVGFNTLATSIEATMGAFLTNPITLIIGALALATLAVYKHIQAEAEYKKHVDELKQSQLDLNKAIESGDKQLLATNEKILGDQEKRINNLQDKIDKLNKSIADSEKHTTQAGSNVNYGKTGNYYKETSGINADKEELNKEIEALNKAGIAYHYVNGEIKIYAYEIAQSNEALDKNVEKINQDTQDKVKENGNLVQLINRYQELTATKNRDGSQTQEMSNIANRLQDKYSDLNVAIDKNGNAMIGNLNILNTKKSALELDSQVAEKNADAQIDSAVRSTKVMVGSAETTIGAVMAEVEAYKLMEQMATANGSINEYVDTTTLKQLDIYDQAKAKIAKLKADLSGGLSSSSYVPSSGGYIPDTSAKDSAKDSAKSASDAVNTLKELESQALSTIQDIEGKIRSVIEHQIEVEKKAVDDRLTNEKNFITAKQKLLEDSYTKKDYDQKMHDENKKKADIKDKLDALELDYSDEGKLMKDELEKQLADQQRVIDDAMKERNRTLQKDALDTQLSDYEKKADADKLAIDAKYSTENVNNMIKNAMATGTLFGDSLATSLVNFEKEFGTDVTLLNNGLQSFITTIQNALKLFAGLKGDGTIDSSVLNSVPVNNKGYADGGVATQNELAMIHGATSDSEVILNGKQATNLLFNMAKMKFSPPVQTIQPIHLPKMIDSVGGKTDVHFDSLVTIQGDVRDTATLNQVKSVVKGTLEDFGRKLAFKGTPIWGQA